MIFINVGTRKRPSQEFFAEPKPSRTSDFFAELNFCEYDLRSYELKLIKVLAELANLITARYPF